jgi:hypothetical protein
MSWINNIKEGYEITTGDGKKYTPNWLNAQRVTEYNVSEFAFKGVRGTLVDRRKPLGIRYDIEIYFQGEDNLNTATAFLVSAENPKKWTISHPLYGTLYVQPTSLKFDDSRFNATRITGTVIETMTAGNMNPNVNPVDHIQALKVGTDETFAASFVTDIPTMDTSDVISMGDDMTTIEKLQSAFVTVSEQAAEVKNAYNTVNAALDATLRDSFTIVNSAQALLNLPATFANTITNRVNFLIRSFQALAAKVESLTLPDLKKIFECNAASVISTACSSTVTGIDQDSYPNRGTVLAIIENIADTYDDYIEQLDSLQTETGARDDSYIPDFNSLNKLSELVYFTLGNLFLIAENAKQERIFTCDADTNVILLAHNLYGLQADDSTINKIISDNMIGLSEMLQVKKGREIIYYV